MTLIQAFESASVGDLITSPTVASGISVKKVSATEATFTERDGHAFTANVGGIVSGSAKTMTLAKSFVEMASKDDWGGGSSTDPVITSVKVDGEEPSIIPFPTGETPMRIVGRNLDASTVHSVMMYVYAVGETEPFDSNEITMDDTEWSETSIVYGNGIQYHGELEAGEWVDKRGRIVLSLDGMQEARFDVFYIASRG